MPCVLRVQNKNIFVIACLEKNFVFHTEICDYFQYLIFKYSTFHRVKELFKWNQSRYGVSHGYPECKTKRIFCIAHLEKKLVFQSEISTFSLIIRLLYFQKHRNFIGSRSYSNQIKLGMEYPMRT